MTTIHVPSDFELDCKLFNEMYKLGTFKSRVEFIDRLHVFKKMLAEELDEIDDVIKQAEDKSENSIDILTGLADLLGDLQVYCASEMIRHQIPVQSTLDIIMSSNFSKLGADGKPIYREDGKVMKGPNSWAPEAKIKEMLAELKKR